MPEVAYQDFAHGNVVVTFDGAVVEFFVEGKGTVTRVHVNHLYVGVQGPNRRGYYEVDFSSSPSGLGGFKTFVHSETWPWMVQLLEAVRAVTGR